MKKEIRPLEKIIDNVTGYKDSRLEASTWVLENPENLEPLLHLAFNPAYPNHYKACWTIEIVCIQNLELLIPHLDYFIQNIKNLSHESAVRPISHCCLLLCQKQQFHLKESTTLFSEHQIELLIETCFDWLLQDTWVAAKAYAMRCLYFLGFRSNWVHEELTTILTQGYPTHSAGYKAAARDILKRLKRNSTVN